MNIKGSKVGKRHSIILTRGELRILIVGVFVVCILSMILGFVMGRGLKELSSDGSSNSEIGITSSDNRDESMEEEPSLTFFKTLPDDEDDTKDNNKESVSQETLPQESVPQESVPPFEKGLSGQVKIDPVKEGSSNRIENEVANKKETSSYEYTIQVSSFRDKSQALSLQSILKKKGYDVRIKDIEIPEMGVWYRVFIGSYTSREDAEKGAKKIQFEERLPTLVTEFNPTLLRN